MRPVRNKEIPLFCVVLFCFVFTRFPESFFVKKYEDRTDLKLEMSRYFLFFSSEE